MSNCGFNQLSTFYDVQKLLVQEYYASSATNFKQFLTEFLEGSLTKYIRSITADPLTSDDDTLVFRATYSILGMLEVLNPKSEKLAGFRTTLNSYELSTSLSDSLDRISSVLANDISIPSNRSSNVATSLNPDVISAIFSANQGYNEKINLGVKIKSKGDVDKLFYGAFNAQSRLEQTLNSNIFRKFLIHSSGERYNVNDSEIDRAIKDYKKDIYKELVDHVNEITGQQYNNSYYSLNTAVNVNQVNPEFSNVLQNIFNYYDSLDLSGRKIEAWEAGDSVKLQNYINFIILSNFDNLMALYGKGIFEVSDATFDNDSETYETSKYRLKILGAIGSGFNAMELYPLLGEQTSIYKTIISSIPIVDSQGNVSPTNKIEISSVNATIARLFQDIRDNNSDFIKFDKSKPLHSMKEVFEYFIKNHFGSTINSFRYGSRPYSAGEQEMVLSIYLSFFHNNKEELKQLVNPKLYKALNTSAKGEKSPLDIIGKSAYSLTVNTNNIVLNHKFSPLNIVISNFNKTYFNNYTQITYNSAVKGLAFSLLDNQIYEGDVIWLKNTINGSANTTLGNTTYNSMITNKVNLVPNSGIVTMNLTNGKILSINLEKGELSIFNGNAFIPVDVDNSEQILKDPVFLKTVEDLTGVSLSDANTISALKNEFDPSEGFVNTIKALGKIASSAAVIRMIIKEPKSNRVDFIKKDSFLDSKTTLYNEEDDEYVVNGVYSSVTEDITRVAKAFSTVNGSLYKATTKVANGTTMPLHAEVRHLYVLQDLIDHLNNVNTNSTNYPIENNLFVANRNFLKSPVIRTYIKDGENIIHSGEMSPVEHANAAIIHEFFGAMNVSLGGDATVYIQPTVFTDKNMHYSIPVKLKSKLDLANGSVISFDSASSEDIQKAMYENNRDYTYKLGLRILLPYIPAVKNAFIKKGLPITSPIFTEGLVINKKNLPENFKEMDKLLGLLTEGEFRNSFYETHGNKYPLIDEIGFRTKPMLGMSESLVYSMDVFSSFKNYKSYLNEVRKLFANDLEEMNFKIEYYTVTGKVHPSFNGLLEKIHSSIIDGMTADEFVKQWVDEVTGYLINSKNIDGVVKLNPLLENFFLIDSFISESYQQISMGTIHNHPTKGTIPKVMFPGTPQERPLTETERMMNVFSLKGKTGFKRQLGGTPGKPLNQDLIDGSHSDLKVVSATDVDLPTFTSFGIEDKMTVTDGAKLTPMAQIILQNNSFQDNTAGLNQKTLSSTLDPYLIGLDQDKCAEHAMTNEMTRRSFRSTNDLNVLYKKAYGIPFTDLTPEGKFLNILRGYNGNVLSIRKEIAPDGLFYAQWNNLTRKYDIIEVESITKDTGENLIFTDSPSYTITYRNLSTGEDSYSVNKDINTLYDLWSLIGGAHSVSINSEGSLKASGLNFKFSDSSHYALVDFINAVGVWTTPKELKTHGISEKLMQSKNKDIIKSSMNRVPTQSTVWQPLKESFINTFALKGSEKSGSMSTQGITSLFTDDQRIPIYFKQNILSTLLLLNSEHETDDAHLTEMSQIVSAIIFNAETMPIARRTYQTIATIINLKLKKLIGGIKEFKNIGNSDILYNEVSKFLIEQFKSNDQKSIATLLANMAEAAQVTNKIDETKDAVDIAMIQSTLGSDMPISSYIYNSFVSMLASSINKDAIKRKYSGIASVLKVSGSFVQVYEVPDGKGGSHVVTSDVFHTKYNGMTSAVLADANNVGLFDWAQIEGEGPILLDTPRKLFEFRRRAAGTLTNGKVEIFKGNWTRGMVQNDPDKVYLFGDNTNDRTVTHFLPKATQAVIRDLPNAIGIDTKHDRGTTAKSYLTDADYDTFVQHVEEQIQKAEATGKTIVIPEAGIGTGKAELATRAPKLFEYLQNRLASLQAPAKKVYKVYGKPRELKPVEVKFSVPDLGIASMSVYDTKEFATILGLMDIADPNRKKTDSFEAKDIFIDPTKLAMLQEILGPHTPSLELYQANAKMLQIKAKNFIQKFYRKLTSTKTITIDGQTYTVDNIVSRPGEALGPNIYKTKLGLPDGISISDITPESIKERLDRNSLPVGGTEAASMYIKRPNGEHLYIFTEDQVEAMPHRFNEQSDNIKLIDGEHWLVDSLGDKQYNMENAKFYTYTTPNGINKVSAIVLPDAEYVKEFINNNNDVREDFVPSNDTFTRNKILSNNVELANKIYSSFKTALEFVAARIPGQGPQSFTGLEIVEFMDEVNTIMTNHFTTWLKGEDYDIDKGFWLGVNLHDNGLVTGWSKYFDYSSPESLKNSLSLPIPTGASKKGTDPNALLYRISDEEADILLKEGMSAEKVELMNLIAESEGYETNSFEVEVFLEDYFTERLSDKILEHGSKNKIARGMFDMIMHPLNQVHAESPISFGDFVDFIQDIAPKVLNVNSYTSKAIIQDANMVGKDVIAIAATGLKVWSGLTYWANQKLLDGKGKDIVVGNSYIINGKTYNIGTIANVNYNNGVSMAQFILDLTTQLQEKAVMTNDATIDVEQFAEDYVASMDLNDDKSLEISAVLSAATDNAKELILQLVNGGRDTAGIYIYLAMMGVKLTDSIRMMNDINVRRVTEGSRTNIFNKSTSGNNLESSYIDWLEGPRLYKQEMPFGIEPNKLAAEYRNILLDMDIWSKNQRYTITGDYSKQIPPMQFSVPKLRELLDSEPTTSSKTVEEILNHVRKEIGPYAPQSSGFNIDDSFLEEEFGSNLIYTRYASVRFIDSLLKYNKEIFLDRKPEDVDAVNSFMKIADDASEITLLGGIFGINQGIKAFSYDQYAFLNKFDMYFFNRYNPDKANVLYKFDPELAMKNAIEEISTTFGIIPEIAQAQVNDLMNSFSFRDFIIKMNDGSDPTYIAMAKILYKHAKRAVNVLDIVDSVPQYREMLKGTIVMDGTKEAIALKERSITQIMSDLEKHNIFPKVEAKSTLVPYSYTYSQNLNEETYAKIANFVDDILMVKWMRSLGNKRLIKTTLFEEAVLENDKIVKVAHPNGKEVTMDLGTTIGRANFLIMFHKLVYDLKKMPEYDDNYFIKKLGLDKGNDRTTGEKYKFFRLPINLMNITEHNINEFNKYVTDFNRLDAVLFGSHSIKDLFFIYNMLIHRDKANKSSFTKLYEKDTQLGDNSLFFNYIRTVAQLDRDGTILVNVAEDLKNGDYGLVDLVSRGISPVLNPDTYKYMSRYIGDEAHKKVKIGDNYVTEFYRWNQGTEKYEKVSYLVDGKTIALSIDNPSSIAINDKLRDIMTTRLNEVFDTISSKIENLQINCI